MIALDPPFWNDSTVGGVVATNSSGPIRRGFGTARDLIIGMSFATLEGKLVKSGGMVVKNVAGLDMAKLLIGSFGTLAAITTVNFRVHALPEETRTFLFSFADLDRAIEKRDAVLHSVLQPMAVDLLSPVAATRLGRRGYLLTIRAGGSKAVLDRYGRELDGAEVPGVYSGVHEAQSVGYGAAPLDHARRRFESAAHRVGAGHFESWIWGDVRLLVILAAGSDLLEGRAGKRLGSGDRVCFGRSTVSQRAMASAFDGSPGKRF
jgi:FAD/FMN-containing dehydrogenase